MPRIKIELPEKFSFTTSLAIRITDINYGGHTGNDAILSLIHEARMQFLNSLGFTELDAGGTGLIMSDAGIEFRAESFYGDVLEISVTAASFTRTAFELYYKLIKKGNGTVVAVAKTGMVCYNYGTKKIAAIPDILLNKLEGA